MKDKLIEERLKELEKSTFRTSFKLREKDINYIKKNGLNKVIEHNYENYTIDELKNYLSKYEQSNNEDCHIII